MWNVNFSFGSNRQHKNRTKTPIAAKWLRKVAPLSLSICSQLAVCFLSLFLCLDGDFLSLSEKKFHPRHECGSYPTAAYLNIFFGAYFTTPFRI